MDSSSSTDDDSTHNKALLCNYCGQVVDKLVNKRKYCFSCKDKCFRECSRCHLPDDSSRFFLNEDARRCLSCEKRLQREREKRKKGKSIPKGDTPESKEKNIKKKCDVKTEEIVNETGVRERLLGSVDSPLSKNRKIGYIPIFI